MLKKAKLTIPIPINCHRSRSLILKSFLLNIKRIIPSIIAVSNERTAITEILSIPADFSGVVKRPISPHRIPERATRKILKDFLFNIVFILLFCLIFIIDVGGKAGNYRLKTALCPQVMWTRGKNYAASTSLFVINPN